MREFAIKIITAFCFTAVLWCGACSKKTVSEPRGAKRVIAAAPAITEIITALGAGERLCAIDRYSRNIEGVPAGLPVLDLFSPDAEAVLACNPDLIISGARSGENPFNILKSAGIRIVEIESDASIAGIYADIAATAELLGVTANGKALIEKTRAEIEAVSEKGRSVKVRKKVYFEISPAPEQGTLGSGTYLNEMIEIIGAENIFSDQKGIVFAGAEEIIRRNPDVILTNVNYVKDPCEEIKKRAGFDHINAVINNAVFAIDADSSSRPSHRVVLALRETARAVYPEYYAE